MSIISAVASGAAKIHPIVSGVAALGGLLFGKNNNEKLQKQSQQWQTAEREASQAYNTSERLASQQWQDEQRLAQNQYAIDVYNQYKSPQALVDQYKAAGLNPRLAMNSAGDLSVASGSSGSAPSGTHVQPSTVGTPYQDVNSLSSGFKTMAEGLSALASAKKIGVDTSLLEDAYNDMLRSYKGKADQDEILGMVNKKYLDKKTLADLNYVLANIDNKNADTKLIKQRFDNLVKEGVLLNYQAEAFWEKHYADMDVLTSEQYKNNSQAQLNEAVAKVQPTIANLNNSLAALHRQQKLTEEQRTELFGFEKLVSKTEAILSTLNRGVMYATQKEQLLAALEEAKRMRNVFENKNWYKENQPRMNELILDIDAFIGSVGQVLSGAMIYSPGKKILHSERTIPVQ